MKKPFYLGVFLLVVLGIVAIAAEPKLEVKGEVTRESYNNMGLGGGMTLPVAYHVKVTVKNLGPEFSCDTVLGRFAPMRGKELNCVSSKVDPNDPGGEKTIPWKFATGQPLEFEFSTNGYTQSLLNFSGSEPLQFHLLLGLLGEKQAVMYTADLPPLKDLPMYELTLVGEAKALPLILQNKPR